MWVNDKKEGKGKYLFADGDIYEGDYFNNLFHGKGIYFYKDGSK